MAALIIGSISPVAASLVVKQLGYKSASLLNDPDRLGELLPQLDINVDLVFISVPDGVEFVVKPYEVAAHGPRKAYILLPARVALLAHTSEITSHPSAQELGYDQLFSFELKDAASLAQILAHHPESSDLIFQVAPHTPESNYTLQQLDLPGYGGRRVYQLNIASSPPSSPVKVASKPVSEADLWSEEMRSRGLAISFASFRKLTSDKRPSESSLSRLVPEDKRGDLDEMKGKASVYRMSTNEMARLLIFFLGISPRVECTFTAEKDLTVAVDSNLECILQHHGDDLNYLLQLYIGSLGLKLDVGDIIQYASSDEIYNWMIEDLERADGLISLDYPPLDDIDGVLIPKFGVPSARFPIDYWLERAFSSPETKHRCFVTPDWSLRWEPIKGTPPKPLKFDDHLTVDEQAIPRKKAPPLREVGSPDAGSDFDIYSDDEEEKVVPPERESDHFYREKPRTVLSAIVDGRIYYIHFIQSMLSNRPAPSYEKIVAAMKSGDRSPSFLAIDNRNMVGILSRE